ncbi:MAG: hypothetical protein Q8K13_11680 [Parvibaculum sp.]|uniref:hypothetical protein n=1 Tax=Parvibaculum sp. TaxID=2024848 RepID=UPI00273228E0|nr:hypothetical protein [Parvibaculum sp.]MDP2150291.1 hypothetical protein [Parvibaculum sp.]
MKHFLLSGAAVLAIAIPTSFAAASVLDAAIGNTVSVSIDNAETRYYLNDNGSAAMATSAGGADVGTWKEADGKLCLSWQSSGEASCATLPSGNVGVGQSFNFVDSEGVERSATLLEGKVPF